MSLPLYDSHNHLQEASLASRRGEILSELGRAGLRKMVVNGTREADWPEVLALARQDARIIPSFGLHPWFVGERSSAWQANLARHLDQVDGGVGEIGLDRWIEGHDPVQQEEVFLWQWRLAAERDLPASIHCLRAWGRLAEILRAEKRPARGFLLHSYGGPREMIGEFAKLGAYFSISGYFAHERKARQREAFRHVPPDRLLIETDAPDMPPPAELSDHSLAAEGTGQPLNHPANIGAVYRFAAGLLGEPIADLAGRVEANFQRLFGGPGQNVKAG